MAVAIASSNTNTTASGTSCVVTKPTGLAVGDLMIGAIHSKHTTNDVQVSAPGGWTSIQNNRIFNGGENVGTAMGVFYKVADAGDVAAANFDFTADNIGALGACVLRITGHSPSVPLNTSNGAVTDNGGSAGSYSFAGITPTFADCLLLLFAGTRASTSHDTYAIVTSNPSWTELFDRNTSFSLGYANRPETSATGNASYAIAGAGANTDAIGALVAIKPLQDVTITPAAITGSSVVNTPTIAGGGTVSPSPVAASSVVNTPSYIGKAPWSKRSRSGTPDWTARSRS